MEVISQPDNPHVRSSKNRECFHRSKNSAGESNLGSSRTEGC